MQGPRQRIATIAVNGRFLAAPLSGVQRVAAELLKALDRQIASHPDLGRRLGFRLIGPANARSDLALTQITMERAGKLTSQAWEQFELPALARGQILLNLCNLAPLSARGHVTMIHDAQVYLSPQSYSPPFRAWYRFAQPWIGGRAARILTVSNYSRDRLVQFGVAPRDKIEVIPNGVDHILAVTAEDGLLAPHGLAPGRFVVAFANTQTHKNIQILLRAFAQSRLADVPLVLIGGHGRAAFLEARLDPPPNAIFTGRITDGEIAGLLKKAACLAFPSRTEGFGLPPLEAMALGCPAIVAPCGALPEVCADGALYVDPDDDEGWGRAIRSYLDDASARQAAVTRGRAHALHFTWARSAAKLAEILLTVAARQTERVHGTENKAQPQRGVSP